MKITILDGYALNPGDLSWSPLEDFGDVTIYDRTLPKDVVSRAKGSEIIIINKVLFTSDIIQQLPQLRCIVVTATGYNNIDIEAASRNNVVVCNAPAYSTMSVAQHVFSLLLHMSTHVANYATDSTNGKWAKAEDFCYIAYPTIELANKTLGIVGMGNIGSQVATIAHSFGMNIVAKTSKSTADLPSYVKSATLDEVFSKSDVISLHCPLTSSNNQFINKTTLGKTKPGVIIINTARGNLINETDMAQALAEGHVGAYGADVLSTEPPSPTNPLLSAPNSFITPHIAWATHEARLRLLNITTNNVEAFIKSSPINVVNP